MPPLLSTTRARFAPLRRPCEPLRELEPPPRDPEPPAAVEAPPSLDALASAEGFLDLTVEPPPAR